MFGFCVDRAVGLPALVTVNRIGGLQVLAPAKPYRCEQPTNGGGRSCSTLATLRMVKRQQLGAGNTGLFTSEAKQTDR